MYIHLALAAVTYDDMEWEALRSTHGVSLGTWHPGETVCERLGGHMKGDVEIESHGRD